MVGPLLKYFLSKIVKKIIYTTCRCGNKQQQPSPELYGQSIIETFSVKNSIDATVDRCKTTEQ